MARWSSERQAEAREAILRAAKDAFELHGYEAATMRQIADAAGLAVGTLFNYFPDKLALLREALYGDLERVIAKALADQPAEPSSLDELFTATAAPFFAYYRERPELSRILLTRSLFARGPQSDEFRGQTVRVANTLIARVEAMQTAGVIAAEASAGAVVLAFFSHYYFVLMTELDSEGGTEAMLDRVSLLARQLETGVSVRRRTP